MNSDGVDGPGDGREARRGRADTPVPDTEDSNENVGEVAGALNGGSVGDDSDRHPSTLGEDDTATKRRSQRGGRRGIRSLLLLLLLLLTGGFLAILWGLSPVTEGSELVEFEVMPGWGASTVARELEREGLVRHGRLFSAYLRLRGLDTEIGEGIYQLDRASSAPELAEKLVRGGRPRLTQVLLPEGIRGNELAQRLEAAGLGSAQEYRELIARPGELRPAYVPMDATLEGYLFPASYQVPLSDGPVIVLQRMIERFEQELTVSVRERLGKLGMSVHEWVTLASLVQSEAGSDQEMPVIAGVFLNRLDLGMPLQSDPTVAYGLGKSLPELDALAGDLGIDHPWNTYTRGSLPWGPISNPGSAALQAVLEPRRVNDQGEQNLYFLHGFDGGEPVFRLNTELEGHNRDVERYLRGE